MIERKCVPREARSRPIEVRKERLEHELDFAHRDLEEGYDWPVPKEPEREPEPDA